jgi:hypothetical protein
MGGKARRCAGGGMCMHGGQAGGMWAFRIQELPHPPRPVPRFQAKRAKRPRVGQAWAVGSKRSVIGERRLQFGAARGAPR